MTGKVYFRAIVPIGLFFCLSLICGNQTYLYLSIAFIQMLKATTPVAVLLVGWGMNVETPSVRVLANVSVIVLGVMIASYGEIAFNLTGFVFQTVGIIFEAFRLILVQRLLCSAEYKMDPLVSLYYFAPVCALMNFLIFLVFEAPELGMSEVLRLGLLTLLANAALAFTLNVSVVFLIGRTSSLVLTLCGVLKDILLVGTSVFVWGSTISLTQLAGYSIALGGLVVYRLGAGKIQEQYQRLHNDGSNAWEEFGEKHPTRRKVSIGGAAALILVMALGVMFGTGKTEIQSVPLEGGGSSEVVYVPQNPSTEEQSGPFPIPTLDMKYQPPRKFDIVVSMYKEHPTAVGQALEAIKRLPGFGELNPNTIVYFKDPNADQRIVHDETKANAVRKLGTRGGSSAAWLTHIIDMWDELAEHTMFLDGSFQNLERMAQRIYDYYGPETGMLSLAPSLGRCACHGCKDPFGTEESWYRVPEIFASFNGEFCPAGDVLLSQSGQFIVSAKRIRGTPRYVYESMRHLLTSDDDHWIHNDKKLGHYTDDLDDPFFGRAFEKSWMIAFQCGDPRLAESCPVLGERRQPQDPLDRCQCLDRNPAHPKGPRPARITWRHVRRV
ncbi:TPT-domain-containing protein [Tuber magnatum]|uniref:TPT-domain-containing protein n=1 Tax=Tuber magnatum TaxID=42249 RepID=A0A317SM89_9PEZI|nr:TPT-domain-containing protein [Tuber magnatum]